MQILLLLHVFYCSFIVILSFVLALLIEKNHISTCQIVPPFLKHYSSTISRIFAGLLTYIADMLVPECCQKIPGAWAEPLVLAAQPVKARWIFSCLFFFLWDPLLTDAHFLIPTCLSPRTSPPLVLASARAPTTTGDFEEGDKEYSHGHKFSMSI